MLIEFGWGQFNMEEEAKLLDENRNKITQLTVITDGLTVLVFTRWASHLKSVILRQLPLKESIFFLSSKQLLCNANISTTEAKIFCISD